MISSAFQKSSATGTPAGVLRTFVCLELAGAVGMAIMLLTALFSPRVKRCTTWYTFCASWIISCVSYCMLFFAGSGEITSSVPRKGVCVTQAALVYSVPTLTACTTLSLLIHGWYNVHFGLSKLPLESHPRIMNILLSTPFIIWSLMFIAFLVDGLQNPALVHNFGLYCTFMSVMPGKVSSLFVIIVTFSTIPIQASLALSLSRNFDPNDATSSISVQTLKMVIRVLIFSFLILIGFAEGIIHLLSSYRSWAVDLIMASLPVSAVLIFGIQRDFFETWARWSGISLIPSFYSYLNSLFYPLLMQDRAQALVDASQTQVTVTSDYTKSYL